MALQSSILSVTPEDPIKVAALAGTTSSAAQTLGKDRVYAFVATGNSHLKFGASAVGAADAGDNFVPANQLITFNTTQDSEYVRVFNATGSAIDCYFWRLSKF